MARGVYESPEFARLFRAYTGSHESIGTRLTVAAETVLYALSSRTEDAD